MLHLLSKQYPSIRAAHSEMINLSAIMALPRGTAHYISDIHGAYDQFDHILRHASGAIRRKISQTFGESLSEAEQAELAALIYYPEQQLDRVLPTLDDPRAWQAVRIEQLTAVARMSSRKYTRSKVRKRLPPQMAYVLEELLAESNFEHYQKQQYYRRIIGTIVDLDEGPTAITKLAYLIQRLVVDRLYILGDIFDRGPAAEKVMDRLIEHHDVAILWGNHDITWMGAAAGCDALIANVVRLSLRYANLETLIDGYGINLRALHELADGAYAEDACIGFRAKGDTAIEGYGPELIARMHKAIAIIQFKLEAQIIKRHPEYAMEDRLLIMQIDKAAATVTLDGKVYPLRDTHWPTLDPDQPSVLSPAEAAVVQDLHRQFAQSERLQRHIRFLYSYGHMVQVQDGDVQFHGCLPVEDNGAFTLFPLAGEELAGLALLERYEQLCRTAYFAQEQSAREAGQDAMWYLWCGPHSPLFGRKRMTTFERYFIADQATHEEPKGAYYALRDDIDFVRRVLETFGGDVEQGRIINGHTPVKVRKGESPLQAGGRVLVIDGGMSTAYQPVTGIAGYTLIVNSHEMLLAAHEYYGDVGKVGANQRDLTPQTERVATFRQRIMIADTDVGAMLRGQLADLHKLVAAYRAGIIAERS
ncbi:MAG: fructose-1,6-bisphosphatase [Oscillochloris sp.]|nr:fructose-1,6-bisphosphatase [Oscillochloris sp.]